MALLFLYYLQDFINETQPFKSMWVSDDDDNTADVLTLKSHKADCSEKGSPSSTEVSAILDEISMDISDSFDEWFTNCCNDLPPVSNLHNMCQSNYTLLTFMNSMHITVFNPLSVEKN